jgi:hypothetical protein
MNGTQMIDNSNDRNGLPTASRIDEIEDKIGGLEAEIYRAVEIALGPYRETDLRQAMNRAFYNSDNPFKQGYNR